MTIQTLARIYIPRTFSTYTPPFHGLFSQSLAHDLHQKLQHPYSMFNLDTKSEVYNTINTQHLPMFTFLLVYNGYHLPLAQAPQLFLCFVNY